MQRSHARLWELLEPVVSGMGYDLIEIEYQPSAKHGVLRLYIDLPGGIQLDDCTEVSRQVSAVLDVDDPIPGQYNLEVSSPGMDRPLRKAKDFTRFAGEIARIRMHAAIGGQRNFKGRITSADDETLQMECENGPVSLPMASIDKARLVPDYELNENGSKRK